MKMISRVKLVFLSVVALVLLLMLSVYVKESVLPHTQLKSFIPKSAGNVNYSSELPSELPVVHVNYSSELPSELPVVHVNYSYVLPVAPRKVYYDNRTVRGKPRNLVCVLSEVSDLVLKNKFSVFSCELGEHKSKKVEVIEDPIASWIRNVAGGRSHYFAMIKCIGFPYEAITNGSIAHVLYKARDTNEVIRVQAEYPLYLPNIPENKTTPTKGKNSVVVCTTMYGHPPRFNDWLKYQKTLGVDRVHLNVDKSFSENATSVYPYLKEALESGLVSMEVWEFNPWVFYHSQSLKYQDCVMRYIGVFDFALMLDYDDFFVPLVPGQRDVHYYVKEMFKDKWLGCLNMFWRKMPCELDPGRLAKLEDGNITSVVKFPYGVNSGAGKSISKLSTVEIVSIHSTTRFLPGYILRITKESDHHLAYVAHIKPHKESCKPEEGFYFRGSKSIKDVAKLLSPSVFIMLLCSMLRIVIL